MAEKLKYPVQPPRPAEKEYENILRQFVSEPYAQVIGMYLWSVEGGVISGSTEFERLCADLKNIQATPQELSIKLNELKTVPKPVVLPEKYIPNHRYSG